MTSAFARDPVLYADDDVIVVDKPVGVSVQPADTGAADDLVSRLSTWTTSAGSISACPPRLRAHGHLDRDLSGVVVLSASSAVHANLARQTAEARLRVSFVVALRSQRLSEKSTLRAWVTVDKKGGVQASRDRAPHARQVAVTATVVERVGDRCLVEIAAPACGPRQVRAVLAATEGAVAGDTSQRGPEASRLMMHAARIELDHPSTASSLRVVSATPWELDAWLRGESGAGSLTPQQLTDAIADAIARRHGLLQQGFEGGLRLVHGEAEGLDGIDVEWFGGYAVVWVAEQLPSWVGDQVVEHIQSCGAMGVYLKVRPKQASRVVHARRASLVHARAVRGNDAPAGWAVSEGGLRFELELSEGLGTGLFLDQRGNRTWVRGVSRGKTVLNLFAYTCGFTVAAAAGGAASTVSVDASARVLELGRRNLLANGFEGANHDLVCDDVVRWLEQASRAGRVFDVVILDPPSFSTTRVSRLSVQRDYESLVRACLEVVSPAGGWLLACTNHRSTRRTRLRSWIRQAALAASRDMVAMRDTRPEADFPARDGEPHMKAVICEVGPTRPARGRGRSGPTRRTTTKKPP